MKTRGISKDQRGVALVLELALVAVLLAVAGVAAYRSNQAKQAQPPAEQAMHEHETYTDEDKVYTVEYPPDWAYAETSTMASASFAEPSGGRVSIGAQADTSVFVSIIKLKTSTPLADLKRSDASANAQEKELTINGYQAFYVQKVFPEYTDHHYFVVKGSTTVAFYFRQKEAARAFGSSSAGYDHTSYLDEFEAIVHSIQFIN